MNCRITTNCHGQRLRLGRPNLAPRRGIPRVAVTIIAPLFGVTEDDFKDHGELALFLANWEHKASIETRATGAQYVEVVQWTEGLMAVLLVGSPGWIDGRLFDPVGGVFAMPMFSDAFLAAKTAPDLTVACALFELTVSDCGRKAIAAVLMEGTCQGRVGA